jgi:hypothetical protein
LQGGILLEKVQKFEKLDFFKKKTKKLHFFYKKKIKKRSHTTCNTCNILTVPRKPYDYKGFTDIKTDKNGAKPDKNQFKLKTKIN